MGYNYLSKASLLPVRGVVAHMMRIVLELRNIFYSGRKRANDN